MSLKSAVPRLLLSLLLAVAVVSPLSAAELAADATPEQVVAESFARMQTGNWAGAADTFDPAALKRFRGMLMPVLETAGAGAEDPGADGSVAVMLGMLFAPAASIDEVKALSDRDFFARFMGNVLGMSKAKLEGHKIIGKVAEGGDTMHVVARNTATAQGVSVTQMEVVTLNRTPQGWRLALSGEFEGMAQAMRRAQEGGRDQDKAGDAASDGEQAAPEPKSDAKP